MKKNRKSVAFLLGNLTLGGTESKIIRLANRLASRCLDVHILVIGRPYTLRDQISDSVMVHCFDRHLRFSPFILWKVRKYIVSAKVDSVVCVNLYPLLYGWISAKRMIGRSSRCIGLVNTSEFVTSRDITFMRLYSVILRRCDKVIFGCKSQAREWISKYRIPQQISTVIYNGVDTKHFSKSQVSAERLRSDLQIGSRTSVIGCIAQLRPEKGHSNLLDAFDRLLQEHRVDAVLVIVGEGVEKESLMGIVHSRGLSDRVRFVGRVEDVRPYLALFDVFVMPSIAVEVFSNAVLEAIAMNVPVVSSDVGGSCEMIEHESDGYIYPRNDSTRLMHYLSRLITNEELANNFRIRALRKLEKMFTLERMDTDYIGIIWETHASARCHH